MGRKKRKGLACVPPERRKEIARMGGLANVNRHRATSDQAREMAWKRWGRIPTAPATSPA